MKVKLIFFNKKMKNYILLIFISTHLAGMAQQIQPTWESMAENYCVPQWFIDGKIGVWFH